ncbi:MAG: ROK family transcriptional regulator [Devosiaceae bacterium]|nr:ROK family transcriptional regulator [Devosiaceae bacterium MH13]
MRRRLRAEANLLLSLAQQGPQSRADLGRAIGQTRATAGNIVARLLEEGIVRTSEPAEPGAHRTVGRPGELVSINSNQCHVIGVDAGIGFVIALRMDLAGTVVAAEQVKTDDMAPSTMLDLVVALVRQVANDAPSLGGVSVSVPGIITREGHVMRAPFLGWKDVPFRDLLARELDAFGPLSLENDANALAMGQVIRGHVSPDEMTIVLSMDVGVGGAILSDGKLMDGQSGLAGEFGHMFVQPSSASGTVRLENFIGRFALLERYRELGGQAASLDAFVDALDSGDELARQVQSEWVEVLAQALSTITSVLNPGSLVFGGSLTTLLERSLPLLDKAYEGLLMHGTAKPRFVVLPFAQHAVARGCCDIRREAIFKTL